MSILKGFSDRYDLKYPLLSDEGSLYIRELGILNEGVPKDNATYGIPHPGSYMVNAKGVIFDKSFYKQYAVRESVNDMLLESFKVGEVEVGAVEEVTTPHLTAKAFFSSPTIRRAQMTTLTVEVDLNERMHVYGRPLPAGYFATTVTVDSGSVVKIIDVEYPEPKIMTLEALGEELPVYDGKLVIQARCRGAGRDEDYAAEATVKLQYQACDDRVCYPPQTITFTLPLHNLPHDWEKFQ